MTAPSPNLADYIAQLRNALGALYITPGVSDDLGSAYVQAYGQQGNAALQAASQIAMQDQTNKLRFAELMGQSGGDRTDAAQRWRSELEAQQAVQSQRLAQEAGQMMGSYGGQQTLQGRSQTETEAARRAQDMLRYSELLGYRIDPNTGQPIGGAPTLARSQMEQVAAQAQAERDARMALQTSEQTFQGGESQKERDLREKLQRGELNQRESEYARTYLLQQAESRRQQAELGGYMVNEQGQSTGTLTEAARAARTGEQTQRAQLAAQLLSSPKDVFKAGAYFKTLRGTSPTGMGQGGVMGFNSMADRATTPGTVSLGDMDAALGSGGMVSGTAPGAQAMSTGSASDDQGFGLATPTPGTAQTTPTATGANAIGAGAAAGAPAGGTPAPAAPTPPPVPPPGAGPGGPVGRYGNQGKRRNPPPRQNTRARAQGPAQALQALLTGQQGQQGQQQKAPKAKGSTPNQQAWQGIDMGQLQAMLRGTPAAPAANAAAPAAMAPAQQQAANDARLKELMGAAPTPQAGLNTSVGLPPGAMNLTGPPAATAPAVAPAVAPVAITNMGMPTGAITGPDMMSPEQRRAAAQAQQQAWITDKFGVQGPNMMNGGQIGGPMPIPQVIQEPGNWNTGIMGPQRPIPPEYQNMYAGGFTGERGIDMQYRPPASGMTDINMNDPRIAAQMETMRAAKEAGIAAGTWAQPTGGTMTPEMTTLGPESLGMTGGNMLQPQGTASASTAGAPTLDSEPASASTGGVTGATGFGMGGSAATETPKEGGGAAEGETTVATGSGANQLSFGGEPGGPVGDTSALVQAGLGDLGIGIGAGGTFRGRQPAGPVEESEDALEAPIPYVDPAVYEDPEVSAMLADLKSTAQGSSLTEKRRSKETHGGHEFGEQAAEQRGADNEQFTRVMKRLLQQHMGPAGPIGPGGPQDAPLMPEGGAPGMPVLQDSSSVGAGASSFMSPSTIPSVDPGTQDAYLSDYAAKLRQGIGTWGPQAMEGRSDTQQQIDAGAAEALGLRPEDVAQAYQQTRFANVGNALLA